MKQKMDSSLVNETSYLIVDKELRDNGVHRNPSRERKLFLLVSCIIQQLIFAGIGYGLSVMYAELIIVFEAKRSETALIQSIFMAIATGGGILFTGVITKIGPGNSMIIGGTVGCIGLFLSSFSKGLTAIILCTGVLSALGMCMCYLAAFIAVSRMFHENAGPYLVILSLGSSIGQFVVPMFYEMFIEQYTWSGAFILMSGIALQNVPFGVIVHYSKRFYKSNEETGKSTVATLCDFSVLKDWLMWVVYINFHLLALTGNFEAWFLVDFAISRGFSRESGSLLITALGFANVVGRIFGGFVRFKCTNMPSLNHWIYLSPLLAIGHVLVVNVNDYWGLFAVCILYGFPFGAMAAQPAAIMLEVTSLKKYPQAMAIANLSFGLANLISGQLGAAGVSIYISLTTGVVALVIKKRKERHRRMMHGQTNVPYEKLK
ncbi:monocarboxylate transporter 6-like isoform X2 [Ruditapes philippinarum]|uniref:monocarboxylate transporter 6-like isoform X2 n=1 Tax=Ruditapes philippinarum TaxID=129788 RepID=UPI00295C03A7|nr:monocarboxylate transporter 6-like isoform X2 [Ruditapes philippinarum]